MFVLKEGNTIKRFSIYPFEGAIETDKNIVEGFDHRFYFEDYTNTEEYTARRMKHSQKTAAVKHVETLRSWFDTDYTHYEQKYRRLISLGRSCDDGSDPANKLTELYEEAEEKRKSIQELEELIKELV